MNLVSASLNSGIEPDQPSACWRDKQHPKNNRNLKLSALE